MTQSRLHRWSKQKTAATEESRQIDDRQPEEVVDSQLVAPAEEVLEEDYQEKNTEDEATPAELPPLESLGDDSDYSMFMSSEVDESLRKLALRKLFKAPFFNIRDGLNDYDEDFTNFEELGDIVTSDMKYHAERKKAEAEQRKLEAEAESEAIEQSQEIETMAGEDDDAAEDKVADTGQSTDEAEVAQESEPTQEDDHSAI